MLPEPPEEILGRMDRHAPLSAKKLRIEYIQSCREQGLTDKTIAEILGVSPTVVSLAMSRANLPRHEFDYDRNSRIIQGFRDSHK